MIRARELITDPVTRALSSVYAVHPALDQLDDCPCDGCGHASHLAREVTLIAEFLAETAARFALAVDVESAFTGASL